ncbi:MAG: tripartite tricarboxylate transporter substrate binding protein BugD, partial [Hyphomicrobiales bacterium]|nr:tripartite tricarboxylate transporter substrate binding protein BugD [Hyphomicrobiales bacterium]
SPVLPNLPTANESGLPNFEAYTWNAIFLPKGAPAPIVSKLHDVMVEIMKTPAVKDRLEALGAIMVPENKATPDYLDKFVKSEIEKWAAPIRASGAIVE